MEEKENESTNILGRKRERESEESEELDTDTELELNKKSVRVEPVDENRAIFRTGTLSGNLGPDSQLTKYINVQNRVKNPAFVFDKIKYEIDKDEFNRRKRDIIEILLRYSPLLVDEEIQRMDKYKPYTWVLFTTINENGDKIDHLIMNKVFSQQEFGTTHEEIIERYEREKGPPHRIYLTGECVLTDKSFIFNLASGSFMMNKLKKYTSEDIIEIKHNISVFFQKIFPDLDIFFTVDDNQSFIRQVLPISEEVFEAFKGAGVPFIPGKKSIAKLSDYQEYIDNIPVIPSNKLTEIKPLSSILVSVSEGKTKSGGTRKKQKGGNCIIG